VPASSLPPSPTPAPSGPPSPRARIKARGLDRYLTGMGVDLDDVRRVKTPAPTETFMPLPHGEYYDQIASSLAAAGIEQVETFHSLYRGGDRYIGLAITDVLDDSTHSDVVVGWFNAHDRSKAATFLLGEQVTVCFNLCLHAEIKVARKHTKHIQRDMPGLIDSAVARIEEKVALHEERMTKYLNHPLSEREGAHLLVRLHDRGAFPKSKITHVLKEWREPSQEEWARAWNINRLYQAVTVQRTPVMSMAQRHLALHSVLDHYIAKRMGSSANL